MNNASAMAIWPVTFNSLSSTVYTFESGLKFAFHQGLRTAQDVTINNHTGIILSDTLIPSTFINLEQPDDLTDLTVISSPLAVGTSSLATVQDGDLLVLSAIDLHYQDNLINQEIFTLKFNSSSVKITNEQDLYLSMLGTELFFAPESISLYQTFEYLLGPTNVCLMIPNTNWVSALYLQANKLSIVNTISVGGSISGVALTLTSRNNIVNNTMQLTSVAVTYLNNPTVYTEELQIDSKSLDNNFYQNWLFQFAIEQPTITSTAATYDVKFHPLKNHQTPLGDYTYEPDSYGVQRRYNSIFSGGSQTNGFEKIYLGYQADSTTIAFRPDEPTNFRFCPTADAMYLSSAGFIENGALGGSVPLIADRIEIHRKDYSKLITNFPTPSSIGTADGRWLCSWLSGDQNNKVWMDRYYNPGYFSLSSDAVNFFIERKDPLLNYIWDIPSQLELEPGVEYQYTHAGKQSGTAAINLIEIDPFHSLGFKTLHISAWNASDSVDDASPYVQNNRIINQLNISPTEYFNFDGNSHIIFSAASSILLDTDFTVSLWAFVEDWNNIQGNQIFGNFDQSGWGLINRQQTIAPLITIIDQNAADAYTLNYKLTLTDTNKLSAGQFSLICRLEDMSYWVVDDLNLRAYHYDPQQTLLASISLPLYKPSHIISDTQSNVYVYDQANQQYVKLINSSTSTPSPSSAPAAAHSITIDTENNLLFSTAAYSLVTSDSRLWEYLNGTIFYSTVVGGHVYNRSMFAAIGNCYGMTADSQDKIYFLLDGSMVSCLDTTTNLFIWTKQIGKIPSVDRFVGIIKAPIQLPDKCDAAPVMQDLLVILDNYSKEIFVTGDNGNLLYYLNASNLPTTANPQNVSDPIFVGKGDFTGFNSIRLRGNQELVWAIQTKSSAYPTYLTTNQSTLAPGWHLFTLVADSQTQTLASYVDSNLIDEAALTSEIDYKYKSSLLLAAGTVMSTTLNDIIGIENICKFVGKVADLRIYRKPLMFDIIQQLYWNSPVLDIPRPDLVWNMPTGQRNYIEEIQQWFTFNMPGSKSKYFNINIYNFPGNDQIKANIEESVKTNIEKLIPSHTQLLKINWLNTK
jgi:hypothetical protein